MEIAKEIKEAMDSLEQAFKKMAENEDFYKYRPKNHFLPQAFWMNDPNGTIFFKGNYHIFFQLNPYGEKWGKIHWGHVITKDFINWRVLPVALYPLHNKGEIHCFSGCAVVEPDSSNPTIFYTSIHSVKKVVKGAEQWAAISSNHDEITTNELVFWDRYEKNPILYGDLHPFSIRMRLLHWRDPYVFKDGEDGLWKCVLGGHLFLRKTGSAFIYSSSNLLDWKYEGILCTGPSRKLTSWNWECPNLIIFNENQTKENSKTKSEAIPEHSEKDAVLIISPHREVIYSVGKYHKNKFQPNSPQGWFRLDHDSVFYATNTINEPVFNRWILFGWLKEPKYSKAKGWSGILAFPREIWLEEGVSLYSETNNDSKILKMDFQRELENMRDELIYKYDMAENAQKESENKAKINVTGLKSNFEFLLEFKFKKTLKDSISTKLPQKSKEKVFTEDISINLKSVIQGKFVDKTENSEKYHEAASIMLDVSPGQNKIKYQTENYNMENNLQFIDKNRFETNDDRLIIHGLVDTSAIEIIINQNEALSSRFYPVNSENLSFNIKITENAENITAIKSVKIWSLKPINIDYNYYKKYINSN